MAVEFFQTKMGQKYYILDLPKLIESNIRLAAAIEKQNSLKEKELRSKSYTDHKDIDPK
jgi:hypothetical protein